MTIPTSTRTACRICGGTYLTEVLNLGPQYVSDFPPLGGATDGPIIPIVLDLCRACSLVQARHTPPPELLYKKHYWYRSGTTQTMRDELRDVVKHACRRVKLSPGDLVLDIGSNDGTLLRYYKDEAPGVITVGVEPAENLAREGAEGIDLLLNDFWSADLLRVNVLKKPKVITACGMFYDLDDPNQFIADIAKVLHPNGIFVAQLMGLKQTLLMNDVGNLAHEHLEFYTLYSLYHLYARNGLELIDAEENRVNGGSYRLTARLKSDEPRLQEDSDHLRTLYYREVQMGLSNPDAYVGFQSGLESIRRRIHAFISDEVAAGKRVWVYGASTKGNVILQWCGLDSSLITAAADRSPEKWGRMTVGTTIPIKNEQEFRDANPDYALILPYAFLEEFIRREEPWLLRGGKFIVPLPQPMLIGTGGTWVTRNPLYSKGVQ